MRYTLKDYQHDAVRDATRGSGRGCPHVRPHDRALDDMLAQAELGEIEDRRLRLAIVYTAAGWRQWEIAQELSVSEKTVERMLANHRQRIQKRRSA